jgi:hypothetical protein
MKFQISGARRSRTRLMSFRSFLPLPEFCAKSLPTVHKQKQDEERDERCQLPFEPSWVEDKAELTHHIRWFSGFLGLEILSIH